MTGAAQMVSIGSLVATAGIYVAVMAYAAWMVWRDPMLRETPFKPHRKWGGFSVSASEMAFVFGMAAWLITGIVVVGVVVLYVLGATAIELAELVMGA
jgi:O-antigen/teichoic acid export membrane protein